MALLAIPIVEVHGNLSPVSSTILLYQEPMGVPRKQKKGYKVSVHDGGILHRSFQGPYLRFSSSSGVHGCFLAFFSPLLSVESVSSLELEKLSNRWGDGRAKRRGDRAQKGMRTSIMMTILHMLRSEPVMKQGAQGGCMQI